MRKNNSRQVIWLRTVRKYKKLITAFDGSISVSHKLDILRRRLLRMNRAWKLGIATASLIAWLNAPAMAQFPALIQADTLDAATDSFRIQGELISVPFRSGVSKRTSVSNIGDLNGDGIDDILLGDSGENNGAGQSYVIFGNSTGFTNLLELSTLDGNNGFILNGIDARDYSGIVLSSAGDINGDGLNDLIIGARGANLSAGESYVVFGSSSGFASSIDLSALNGSNGFILNGIDGNDASGYSVSSAGDVNGDGIDDLIIGAPRAIGYGTIFRYGESYVVFGNSTGFASSFDLSTLNGSNGFILNGADRYDRVGCAVSSAGDVNGDGIDDLLIGAFYASPNGSRSGKSHIIFGNSAGFVSSFDLSTLNGSNGFTLNGSNAGNRVGVAVSSLGDVNGDTKYDFIIGGTLASPNGNTFAGQSYVVFGNSAGFASNINLSSLDGSNGFALNGVDTQDRLGSAISSAGDLNDDGINDIVIGVDNGNPNGTRSGEAYIIFGKNTGFTSTFDFSTLDGTNGFRVDGPASHYIIGTSVSSAGDVNGDGVDDLLLGGGGYYYNGGGGNPNSVRTSAYVIFGQSSCVAVSPTLSVAVSPAQVQEDAGISTITYTFIASLSPTCEDLSINFSVSGDATFNDDYFLVRGSSDFSGSSGTVVIPQGQTSVDLVFQVQQDAINESDETIIITIDNP